MSLWRRLFGRDRRPSSPQHLVRVEFSYGGLDPLPLFELESQLERALRRERGLGAYLGNEMAPDGSRGSLALCGPDADAVLAAILPVLRASDFARTAKLTLRYGPDEPGVRVRELQIGR